MDPLFGQRREVSVSARALTALSQRERTILHNAAEVICSLDGDGTIMAINRACLHAWGYSPTELLATNLLHLVCPQQRQLTALRFSEHKRDQRRFQLENELLRKDSSLVSVRWSVNWSESEQRFFCVAHDITQQKHVEKLKAQFVAMVSHDLRAPLTSIYSFLELMIGGGYGELPTALELAAVLGHRSMKRLIKLTEDLVDLEKLESGAFTLKLGTPDIRQIVEDAHASLKQFADDARVSIDLTRVNRCRLRVEGDQARLTQVVVNLLSNAIKFSAPGSTVAVAALRKGEWVELSIIDAGRGIPPHMLAVVFDRFRQVENNDASRGSGLGLAISKTIIDQHGGKIGADSRVGCGSRFWFRVRLAGSRQVKSQDVSHSSLRTSYINH